MKKLISYAAAGILLLAAQSAVAAGLRGASSVRSVPSFAGAIHTPMIRGGAPIYHPGPGPMIGAGVPKYHPRPGPMIWGGAPIYHHGRFHHRRFIGPGVFTYGVVPYFYDGYYANYYDDEDCYVWVRRHGVLHRVYVCE